MLDNKAELLLEYISNYCGAEYKIITVKELQNALPSYLNSTEETIKNLIKTLSMRELIINKYFDGEQYCLKCLPKGKDYLESRILTLAENHKTKKQVLKLAFFSSFFGGGLGGFLAFIITQFF